MKNPRIYKNKIYTVEEVVRLVEILNSSINPPLPNHVRRLTSRGKDGRLHTVEIAFNEFDERFFYRSEVLEGEVRIETHSGFFIYRNHRKAAKVIAHCSNRTEVVYAVEIYLEKETRYRAFYKEDNKYAECLVESSLSYMSPVACAHTGTGLFFVAMEWTEWTLNNVWALQ